MYTINIFGKASQKVIKIIEASKNEEEMDLLNFLQSKGIPIASSCQGEGVCKTCVINENQLACLTTLKKLISALPPSLDALEITIDYL